MTQGDTDQTGEPSDEPLAQPRGGRPLWPWFVLLGTAVLGLILGNALGSRESSLVPEQIRAATARPTIVIAARATPPLPSPVSLPSVVSSPSVASEEEYVVQAGDSLRSIALRLYGDVELWARLYERNRDVIGPDPNTVRPGMRLRIPRN
jgi:Tfp pilus assembly protein FimV